MNSLLQEIIHVFREGRAHSDERMKEKKSNKLVDAMKYFAKINTVQGELDNEQIQGGYSEEPLGGHTIFPPLVFTKASLHYICERNIQKKG